MTTKERRAKELDADLLIRMFIREDARFDPLNTENYDVLKAEIIHRLEVYDRIKAIVE